MQWLQELKPLRWLKVPVKGFKSLVMALIQIVFRRCVPKIKFRPIPPGVKMAHTRMGNSPAGRLVSARVTGHAGAEANCVR